MKKQANYGHFSEPTQERAWQMFSGHLWLHKASCNRDTLTFGHRVARECVRILVGLVETEFGRNKMSTSTPNNGSSGGQCETHIEYQLANIVAQASFVIFILILDVCGNCMVIGAILLYPRLRVVTNYFIISLAVSDLLIAALSMPFRIHHTLNNMCWDLGLRVCEFWVFVDLLCSVASMTNLSLISVDRYLALSFPLTYRSIMTKFRGFLAIAFVWLYSLLISTLSFTKWSPVAQTFDNPACLKTDKYYYTFAIIVGFFLPLIILIVAYSLVFKVALGHARRLQLIRAATLNFEAVAGNDDEDGAAVSNVPRPSVASIGKIERKRRKSIVRELKATKTLAIVVGTFIVCWLPFFIIMLTVQFCSECLINLPDVAQQVLGIIFVSVLPLLNSAVNPVIYSSFNNDFRTAFKNIIYRACKFRRETYSSAQRFSEAEDEINTYVVNTSSSRDKKESPPARNGVSPPEIIIQEPTSMDENPIWRCV